MQICSTSLLINKIQMITTVSYHFTPTRISMIKKTLISVGKNIQKLDLHTLPGEGGCKMVQLLWQTVWQFL